MLELTIAALILSIPHLAVIYYGIHIMKLTYAQIFALNTAISVASAIAVKVFEPEWKAKMKQIYKKEGGPEFGIDALLMVAVFIVSAILSAVLMYRAYGLGAWAGLFGANVAVASTI
jgi:hypothetical protein